MLCCQFKVCYLQAKAEADIKQEVSALLHMQPSDINKLSIPPGNRASPRQIVFPRVPTLLGPINEGSAGSH